MAADGLDERAPLLARTASVGSQGARQRHRQAADELDFDARFRQWKAAVARKFRGKAHRQSKPTVLITHFDGLGQAQRILDAKRASALQNSRHEVTAMSSAEFQHQVEQVKHAISKCIYPKMIVTGSSGSYFIRILSDPPEEASIAANKTASNASQSQPPTTVVAVFKPKDEEPYGNLNPKRQFLRKYLWWAMGRPCLIPNFSYLSEVGASYLDSRLALQMVPRTELVQLSSPTFHYAYSDRVAYEEHRIPLPDKIGSYQTFLKGYVNASDFLRKHPWPSRTRSKTLLIRDMDEESRAHKVSRRKERARLRNCGVAVKRLVLCRPSWEELNGDPLPSAPHPSASSSAPGTEVSASNSPVPDGAPTDGFSWTPKLMEQFRLQLERLVVLDFLMRNTDRGLDNFMIRHDVEKDEIKIGAIDNSLSFPIKHPNEIRQYPFGWLFLPSDLIGLPFSDATREHLLPILNDPAWWQHTTRGLRKIFEQDPYFDQAKFDKQMSVMRGQGWTLVQSLRAADEGPLDLCAREKKLIRQEVQEVSEDRLEKIEGFKAAIDSEGHVVGTIKPSEQPSAANASTSKPSISRTISSGVLEQERRPIGIRASESYRKALLQAAGTDAVANDIADLEDGSMLPAESDSTAAAISSSLPQSSTLSGKMASSALDGAAHLPNERVPSRHQRMASANDVGTLSRRRADVARGSDEGDGILSRTGIEILEGLDRERKRNRRRGFLRSRQRSSTISSSDAAATSQGRAQAGHRTRQSSEDAGRGAEEGGWDLASSVMSDPGMRFDGTRRWPRSQSATRPAEGMVGSLYDLHSQDEVLSEEEEEGEEDDDAEYSRGDSVGAASGPSSPTFRRQVPTIDSVLQAHSGKTKGSPAATPDEGAGEGRGGAFVPHIPHPRSVGRTGYDADNADNEHRSKGDSTKRLVKVVVEKISSDTKQAWLKWI
jgi:hypothetical protein